MPQKVHPLLIHHKYIQGSFSLDSSHRENVPLPQLNTCRRLLKRYAEGFAFEGPEVKPGACRLGHDEEEEGVQTGVDAAQTHRHFKVHVQSLRPVHGQLQVMEEVQDSGGSETQQEDDEHQRAGLDVHRPVQVRSVELADNSDVARDRERQRRHQAEDGQEQVVIEQEGVGVVVQRQHVMAGDEVHLREPIALLHEELGDDGGAEHPPHGHADPRRARPLGESLVHERVHHGQVALDADAGQRLGRAVQVAIETGRDQSAGGLPEHPVVSMEMVVSLEEEGEEEEEVGDGQAAVQDGRGHLPDLCGQQAQDGDVGGNPNNHGQHINDGDDPSAQSAAEEPHRAVAQ